MSGFGKRRWWALGAISLAVLAVTLDVTVLTVALPTLADALKASEAQLQWFVTAYTLALVAAMLPAGLLGDRYGRRAGMMGALALFAVGSVSCALAPTPEAFIVTRAVLGVAGAGVIVLALSIVTVLFDESERPRAVGIWGAANFVGLPLGPILGGWILTNAWWGWIFLLNVPVALLGLLAIAVLVPESRAPRAPRIDLVGVALSSAGLVAVMYGLVEAGDAGWDAVAIVSSVVGLGVLAAFVAWERRVATQPGGAPLVELSLFRSRSFTWGVILTAFGVFGLFGALFALPQYFVAILGVNPEGAGVRLLPVIAGLIVGAVPADRVARAYGPRATIAIGFAVLAVGMAVGSTTSSSSGDAFIAAWTFVAGAGAGLGFATAASAALVELSAERSGVGSALLQTVVKLGPAFGATILGSVLNASYQGHLALVGLPDGAADTVRRSVFEGLAVANQLGSAGLAAAVRTAFVAGIDAALEVAAGVAVAAVALAVVFLPHRTREVGTADAAGGAPAGGPSAAIPSGPTLGRPT